MDSKTDVNGESKHLLICWKISRKLSCHFLPNDYYNRTSIIFLILRIGVLLTHDIGKLCFEF